MPTPVSASLNLTVTSSATIEVSAHSFSPILKASRFIGSVPVAVVAYTIKGKGVSFMEGDAGWHGKAPNPEQTAAALAELVAAVPAPPAEGGAQ